MATIKIDKDFLAMVMEDHNGLASYFLDRETGEIERLADGYLHDNESFEEMLDENPDRFLAVETMPSSEAFGIMEDFVDSLPDGKEKRVLEKALSWKKPFRNFKDALAEMGSLRDEWFAFHDKRMSEQIQKWLELHGVDAEFMKPGETR